MTGSVPDHVGHDRHAPIRDIVEDQRIAGEPHRQGDEQHDRTAHPLQFAGRSVGARDEDPDHMEEQEEDHEIDGSLVQAPHEPSEIDLVRNLIDALIGLPRRRHVIKRQQQAGRRPRGRTASAESPPACRATSQDAGADPSGCNPSRSCLSFPLRPSQLGLWCRGFHHLSFL